MSFTFVGAGRVGTALHRIAGPESVLVRRGEPVPARSGPVVLCTRNDDLADCLTRGVDAGRLVFVQNGALLPWLEARGLGHCTQGLLYFAVPEVGAAPAGGAPSTFYGPHAAAMVALLQRGGLPAQELGSRQELANAVAIKLLWACILGLLGSRDNERVGESARREAEITALVAELMPVCAAGFGATAPPAEVVDAILRYSRSIPEWRASLKELAWRNDWLIAAAARAGLPTPLHRAALADARRG